MIKYVNNLLKIYHTVKYLKFKQLYFRVYYKYRKPKYKSFVQPKHNNWQWSGPLLNKQSILSDTDVIFLNQKGTITNPEDWNCPTKPKLWLYNLHYFDDLCANNALERQSIHHQFIQKWIDNNPPCLGNGWEPYPISLRLVNWVKWCSVQRDISPIIVKSMFEQAHVLTQQLEYHILGNHLFANAKALTFVGAYLQGEYSEKLLSLGIKLLNEEIKEQFLADGAHFELSPMYHEILLWDLLELIDLVQTSQLSALKSNLRAWIEVAEKALSWLTSMIHSDGEVSFFNDAAIGIAMHPKEIFDYAQSLGLTFTYLKKPLVTNSCSGYSRVTYEQYSLIFDYANVGSNYLPGHAHADTLSFEVSIGSQRVFVNSGTSLYGTSPERIRQRQTAAHNTVVVQGFDSSQVWSGFRVAKRAYAQLESAINESNKIVLVASHDGYMKQSPKVVHTRELLCLPNRILINDRLSKVRPACFHLHLHPSINVISIAKHEAKICLGEVTLCRVKSSEALVIRDSTWHPEFGKSIKNKKIEIDFTSGNLKVEIMHIQSKL